MSSLSSQLLSSITAFRNPNGTEYQWATVSIYDRQQTNLPRVALAEVGYLVTIPFSVIETALSLIAKTFSLCFPVGEQNHEAIDRWMHSSIFSIAWASCDAVLNVSCNDLIVTEKVARACAVSGNIFAVPLDALKD